MAVGDLNNDGFIDVVSISDGDVPAGLPQVPAAVQYGSPFDDKAVIVPILAPGENPGEFVYTGAEFMPGSLGVQISSGDNGNTGLQLMLVAASA